MKALAIDIGGTKIYSALVDKSGKILTEIKKYKTPKTLSEIIQLLKDIIESYDNDFDVVAIATAGAVNLQNNAVLGSTGNLPKGYPDINFSKLSDKKIFLENDANAAAWAEHFLGASKGCSVSIMITLGTGVGGGIIINNKLFKGKDGTAGEMHFKMRTDKHRLCSCGSYDCFEAYASGTGLAQTAREILKNDSLTSYDVIKSVEEGDSKMINVFEKWQNDIYEGLLGLTNLFNPDCIVISGSMAKFVDVKNIEEKINRTSVATPVRIAKAAFENNAGLIGASLLAFESL